MALILNIETSTKNCSVSLARDGEIVEFKEFHDQGYSHGELLHVYIDEVLKASNILSTELDAVAVSKGPGSYTGLRIGVAAAKGLCFSLDIPLIAIDTLAVLARSIKVEKGDYIVPLLDARRMEVYSAVFDAGYNKIRETRAEVIDANSFNEQLLKHQVYFLGDGAEKCQGVIDHCNAKFLDNFLPSANQMGTLSYKKFIQSETEDVAYFEPLYLKEFLVTPSKKNLLK